MERPPGGEGSVSPERGPANIVAWAGGGEPPLLEYRETLAAVPCFWPVGAAQDTQERGSETLLLCVPLPHRLYSDEGRGDKGLEMPVRECADD